MKENRGSPVSSSIASSSKSEFSIPLSTNIPLNCQKIYDRYKDDTEDESLSDTMYSSDELSDDEEFTRIKLQHMDWFSTLGVENELSCGNGRKTSSGSSPAVLTNSMQETSISRSKAMTFHENKAHGFFMPPAFMRPDDENIMKIKHTTNGRYRKSETSPITMKEYGRTCRDMIDGSFQSQSDHHSLINIAAANNNLLARNDNEELVEREVNSMHKTHGRDVYNYENSTIIVNDNENYNKWTKCKQKKMRSNSIIYSLKIVKDNQHSINVDYSEDVLQSIHSANKALTNKTYGDIAVNVSIKGVKEQETSVGTQTERDMFDCSVEKSVQTIISCALPDLLLEAAFSRGISPTSKNENSINKNIFLQRRNVQNHGNFRRPFVSCENNAVNSNSGSAIRHNGSAHTLNRKSKSFDELNENGALIKIKKVNASNFSAAQPTYRQVYAKVNYNSVVLRKRSEFF